MPPGQGRPLQEFAAFLRHHAPHILDCAARRTAGQAIGSGAVEKAVDLDEILRTAPAA